MLSEKAKFRHAKGVPFDENFGKQWACHMRNFLPTKNYIQEALMRIIAHSHLRKLQIPHRFEPKVDDAKRLVAKKLLTTLG